MPDTKATSEELQALYDALTNIGLRPGDIVPQLRRDGFNIRNLSELPQFQVRKLTQEARALYKGTA